MKICFLTQTANDISDYYKEFFKNRDIYFITFKDKNDNAISFMPKSSWSDGRNALWENVKNKYDYYVFIDDDLIFYNFNHKVSYSPLIAYLYYKIYKQDFFGSYEKSSAEHFLSRLKYYLQLYKPEVLSIFNMDGDTNSHLDSLSMRKNSFVRRLGYFDAQFTVMSNYAANKLLPYDTKISGWWSSQIPIYLYSFHVFGSKAISVSELAASNRHHVGAYVENYDGIRDCQIMINKISEATGIDYINSAGSGKENVAVNLFYGESEIKKRIPKPTDSEDYVRNFQNNLQGIEKLLHSGLKM